ncbi:MULTISPECIES: gamma-glutamyl-gamma-aminobutyrate hydrolase family protein [Micrococcaceae]|jgi:putative glutamine amidotransferase|uniref:Glutamine amidotransferases n=1 Tax=Paenarthrobacter aurescens (strain TC1) TaxID=290340 RepID=A1R3M3_PAEAT|nr:MULTISPECIES: gamma-glutamyl-gamma-aminobutyrate hydrolase family protein [Micrococcaceae]ABM07635.1 putative glutamine amidotransferases [Paenarthrobacter aurescens TC1]AFR27922.1 glutamine amidotransferase domain-containing protein [Arthrobacter sp. Rue61a]MBP2267162.1 putative glutamine amidotransferase [Pseudarthrobacter sp. PvP004]
MKSSEVVRPRIGVPVRLSSSDAPDARVGEANELFTFIVDLLREAGAQPVLLTPVLADSAGRLATEMQTLDGVLLPGGGDINPRLYGQDPDASLYDVNPEQDHLDMDVARATIDAGLPLLGVCRGHQLLNVLYGGTLIQDMAPSAVNHNGLDPHDPEASEWAWHNVLLTAGSKTAGLYGSPEGSTIKIASGHHQAVSRVGEGLLVTAVADDGTVEALEDPSRWVVSVQWHPEASQLPDAERLLPFQNFVDVCRNPTHGPSTGVQ